MTDIELMALLQPIITSRFGDTAGRTSPHKGVDVAMSVRAAGTGKVIAAVNNVPDNYNGLSASGAGNYVWIQHADGWVSKYMHLDGGSVSVVVGQTVAKGQHLGIMGNTGNSTGAHLHIQFERNGEWAHPSTVPALGAPVAQPTQPASGDKTCTVKAGDSLWGIANDYLGNGARYTEIAKLNGIVNNLIHPGQVLRLP